MEINQPLLHLNCDKGNLSENNNKKRTKHFKKPKHTTILSVEKVMPFFFLDNFLFLMNF